MRTLVAGPWIGEFGWEICTWAPLVNAIRQNFDSTIVITNNPSLYRFPCQHIRVDPESGFPDRWLRNKQKPHKTNYEYLLTGIDYSHWVTPNKRNCLKSRRLPIDYGPRYPSRTTRDVAIHARIIGRCQSSQRNWGRVRWERFVDELEHTYSNVRFWWIGLPKQADYVASAASRDCRDMSLREQIDVLRVAHVCVGTSSGPMHLASAVGCPHVVMTSREYRKVIKATNRDRYEKLWNPNKTPVTVLDKWGWRPPVNNVVDAVCEYLER